MITKEAVIVTVRTSSKRLPNKAIMEIKPGIKSIDIVIKRAKKIGSTVILATSNDVSDDILVQIAKQHKIEVFRGALLNKIKRLYDCFVEYQIERAVIIEADDIAFDYTINQKAITELRQTDSDMIMYPPEIVTGLFLFVLKKNALEKLYSVVPYENTNTDVSIIELIKETDLNISQLKLEPYAKNKKIRLTLDYPEDLKFFQELYNNIDTTSSGKTIIDFCEKNKSITEINFYRQKDYLDNQKKKSVSKKNGR